VVFGVVPKNDDGVVLGKAMLLGRLLERLARRNCDEKEKRRFFFSSLGSSFSFSVAERISCFSGVGFSRVALHLVDALDLLVTSSGSSEASREEGAEFVELYPEA
jgi:hypothetical protein